MILCERDLDEVLDSQACMLLRSNQLPAAPPDRRRILKEEYRRTLEAAKAMLALRPGTQLLVIEHRIAISDAMLAAERMNTFSWAADSDVAQMAAVVANPLSTGSLRCYFRVKRL